MEYVLHQGDCLEYMERMRDGSVSAIITDPPYGVGLQYGGEFTDDMDYIQSVIPSLIEQGERIAKVLLFPSGRFAIERWIMVNHPPRWRICWYKGAQSTASAIGFSDWEMILVYGKDIYRSVHDYFFAKTESADNGHPCPKSVQWASWLIAKFTEPGDLVFDPFMGSGTTGVACMQLGRNFIGCEISPQYYGIAEKRIKAAASQGLLFATPPNSAIQPTLLRNAADGDR